MNKKALILLVVLGLGFGGQTVFGMKRKALAIARNAGQKFVDGIDYGFEAICNAVLPQDMPEDMGPENDPNLLFFIEEESTEAKLATAEEKLTKGEAEFAKEEELDRRNNIPNLVQKREKPKRRNSV